MKKLSVTKLLLVVGFLIFAMNSYGQNQINWTSKQLIEPSELANEITTQKDTSFIISVGPGAVIPNSVHVGMGSEKEGLDKLKETLSNISKDRKIVIYCGCCPFEHCPNVRPAINVLKEMNFSSYYLLNIPNNIKKDWIDQGYPVEKSK